MFNNYSLWFSQSVSSILQIVLYVCLGLIAIIVLLIGIAAIRTIFIKSKETLGKRIKIDEALNEVHSKELGEMIRIETLSYTYDADDQSKFDELHNLMEKMFPKVHETMEKEYFKGGSILFKWKGKSSDRPMVLMAHQDVVPAVKDDWEFEPFSGTVTKDEILGRGTLDTKSTLYGIFRACEELIGERFVPEQDIYISSASDEEISGDGAQKSVDYLTEKGVSPYIVLDEGGAIVTDSLPSVKCPMAMVGLFEKGYCNIKFTAISKGGHSSTPPKNTPIARLAAFINDVENNFPLKTKMLPQVRDIFENAAPQMSYGYRMLFGNMWLFKGLVTWLLPKINSFGRALLSTTIAFTMQEGSKAENVIPAEAYVVANLRTQPFQDVDESFEVLQKIAAKYDIKAEITERRNSSKISTTEHYAWEYLSESIKKVFPDLIVNPYVMLGGSDCRFFGEVTDHAYRFSPVRMSDKDLKKIHGKNESMKRSALTEAVVFYKNFVKYHK